MTIFNYIACILLIVLGLYAVCTQKNLLKTIIGLSIIDYGVNLLIVSTGFNDGGSVPIYQMSDLLNGVSAQFFVDPVPQALTLTSIVIGACVNAMSLAIVVMIKKKYGSINVDDVRRLRG